MKPEQTCKCAMQPVVRSQRVHLDHSAPARRTLRRRATRETTAWIRFSLLTERGRCCAACWVIISNSGVNCYYWRLRGRTVPKCSHGFAGCASPPRFPRQDCGPRACCLLSASPDQSRGKPPVKRTGCPVHRGPLSFFRVVRSHGASVPRPAAPGCVVSDRLPERRCSGAKKGHEDPVLPRPAGGATGADVRPSLGGSDERVPPRPAAGVAGQTQPDVPDLRTVRGGQEEPPPGQPAQHLPVGLQDLVRAEQVSPLHPRGVLPV